MQRVTGSRNKGKVHLSGYSLMEVLVCFFLLALLILFVMSIYPFSIKQIKFTENIEIAANLANDINDNMSHSSYDSYLGGGQYTHTANRDGISYSQLFNWSTSVSTVGTNLKDILITVTWNEPGGTKTRVYETMIFKLNQGIGSLGIDIGYKI